MKIETQRTHNILNPNAVASFAPQPVEQISKVKKTKSKPTAKIFTSRNGKVIDIFI